MRKFTVSIIILAAVILSLVLEVLFGSFFSAKISTLPVVRKFNLLQPQAPIVINTREEVRVGDSEDVLSAFNKAKPKIGAVLLLENGAIKPLGSAIVISADGLFMTTKAVVGNASAGALALRLYSGDIARAEKVMPDPGSSLVIIKAQSGGGQLAAFGDSTGLVPGQRLVLASADHAGVNFFASFVHASEGVWGSGSSNTATRTFSVQQVSGLVPGHAVVSMDGEILGLWDGGAIVPSSVLKNVTTNYFTHNGSIIRPSFGFAYRFIFDAESKLFGIPVGARVVKAGDVPAIQAGSPAEKAGLKPDDIIVEVQGSKLNQSYQLEQILEKVSPGESLSLAVVRGEDAITLQIIAGELKY